MRLLASRHVVYQYGPQNFPQNLPEVKVNGVHDLKKITECHSNLEIHFHICFAVHLKSLIQRQMVIFNGL